MILKKMNIILMIKFVSVGVDILADMFYNYKKVEIKIIYCSNFIFCLIITGILLNIQFLINTQKGGN